MQKSEAGYFAGPSSYDRCLGPLLFEPYATHMAARLSDLREGAILEIAAGTGIATEALDGALSPGVRIVATDLVPGMIDLAASKNMSARVSFQQADAMALPFDDESFDAVLCQFGVMFFPDKEAAFRETLRVLKPGGRFVFAVWDDLARNDCAHIVHDAVGAQFAADPPDFLARGPYGFSDSDALAAVLGVAGFVDVACESVACTGTCDSPEDAAVGLCHGTPLRLQIEDRDPNSLARVTTAVARALRERFGENLAQAAMRATLFTARKP